MMWQPEMLRQLTDAVIETLEDGRAGQLSTKAREAKLPAAVVNEIERDAAFPPVPKKMMMVSSPRVAAKWLNKSGVSAEHSDELALATSLAAILVQGKKLNQRLAELIAASKAIEEKK